MSNRKFKLFLSHIHEERNVAITFKRELEEIYLGAIDIFVSSDEDGIPGGEKWLRVIEEKLTNAEIILILASPDSIKRPWVNFEAGGGWFLKRKVVPLCIRGMTPANLPEPLHSLQAYDLQDKDGLKRVLNDISKSADLKMPKINIDDLLNRIVAAMPEQKKADEGEEKTTPQQSKTKTNSLAILGEHPTVFFSNRTAEAFPGIRGVKWFDDPHEALERLLILLQQPLRLKYQKGEIIPIWWSRGNEETHISEFVALSQTKCLMNIYELELNKVAVYRARSYYHDFVYVEVKPEQPIGLYDYSGIDVDRVINSMGYFNEEYGLLGNTPITRAEYDDGAAVINNKVVDARSAELRVRYLSKYNFIIAADSSPILSPSFEDALSLYLNGFLTGTHELNQLVEDVEKLKKSHSY
jgi:hypothetical protein